MYLEHIKLSGIMKVLIPIWVFIKLIVELNTVLVMKSRRSPLALFVQYLKDIAHSALLNLSTGVACDKTRPNGTNPEEAHVMSRQVAIMRMRLSVARWIDSTHRSSINTRFPCVLAVLLPAHISTWKAAISSS
jgi:hypothetical protein